MSRIHNFNAGPGVLPAEVLAEAKQAVWNVEGSGIGILEHSHRADVFEGILERAKQRLHRLLRLGEDQEVLFLHGGARTQFFMLPMNLLQGRRATYLDTGIWARGAAEQAARYGEVDVPFSSKSTGYDRVPQQVDLQPTPDGTLYLHYTSNNTVAGTEYHYIPSVDVPLVCDMSSDILSRPIDCSRFHFIYAGAQKNMGPAGVTVVIVKREWLDEMDSNIPQMLQYPIHVAKNSMLNTPCTFGIYMIERVAAWLEARGGLEWMAERNNSQAERLYAAVDSSSLWQGKVQAHSRSKMNVTFTSGREDLDTVFWKSAAQHGLAGLKGHRSVGGIRASIYNAQTDEAVDALIAFMAEFEKNHG